MRQVALFPGPVFTYDIFLPLSWRTIMKPRRKIPLSLLACLLVLSVAAAPSFAQNLTSGSISGTAVDQQNAVLPGATVEAVHGPTGTQYAATTDAEGRFVFLSVRVGGPYSVTVIMPGFRPQTVTDITVSLGEERALNVKLTLQNVTENVTVTAQASVFNPTRAGTADNIAPEQLEQLPTISRSLSDFARVSPYFN